MSHYVIENKLTNLIPIVNPGLKGKQGIEAALLYRILPCKEIDSSDLVKEAYQLYYDEPIPAYSDTILNAFIPFRDFCVSKLLLLSRDDRTYYPLKNGTYRNDLNELIYLYLDDIFYGYEDLRHLFDRYFDLMYSFSNFMPVPAFFNGTKTRKGKGDWRLNKDYPSMYLKNLNDENSQICNRIENKQWLDENMEKYKVKAMYSLQPPYDIKEYYGNNDDKLDMLKEFIMQAIKLIENRLK
ncbi:hypothetical protein [Longibaculum muris]|uniref:Uncharacterized protein n=1 Tax=Longibaculum muris TaxID=1796628 RepID=A0A4V2W3R4_9FIRM|nr:hypothetical protein [Longibaculum muris]KXU52394.1 hypothetical protein HMPREF3037_00092 [Candidatus Stoquefichus sp. KLE1796]MCR1886723.1 hypothetical protein [Longibaculum muris]TCV92949.1 hypothetical protein EDD60_12537 [Longibaculum muris]